MSFGADSPMHDGDMMDLTETAEAAPKARTVLARRLADLVALPSSRISPRERWIVGDLLLEILRSSDAGLRKRCAERLSAVGEAPHRLLRMLACDEFEIAQPILENCEALTDFDMMEIAAAGTIEHRVALARREPLSETVAAALVASGEALVQERVLRNRTATLATPTLDHLVSAAKDDSKLADLLIGRIELRPTQALRLFWWCNHALRIKVLERFAVDRTLMIEAAEDVFPLAAAEGWNDPLVRRALTYIDRRQRNREAAELSPFGSLEGALEEMERVGRNSDLSAEIATLAGINRNLVRRMFDDFGGEALAVLCKATGLKWPSFVSTWRGLGRDPASNAAEEARIVYDSISVERAQTVLRYWNLSIDDSANG